MITEKLQRAINDQITAELWSANLYLSMSFYMEKEGFSGMAAWLKKQSQEENDHACQMASYLIKRGGVAFVDKVDVVPNEFGTPLEVFQQVYEHECRVSKMIDREGQGHAGFPVEFRTRAGGRGSHGFRHRGGAEESRRRRHLLH